MYWSGVYIGVKKREAEYICTREKNDQDLLSEVSKLKSSKHSFQIRDVKKVLRACNTPTCKAVWKGTCQFEQTCQEPRLFLSHSFVAQMVTCRPARWSPGLLEKVDSEDGLQTRRAGVGGF